MLGLGLRPELADAVDGDLRRELEDRLDLGEWHSDLPQRRNEVGPLKLALLVEAVAVGVVDAGGRQQAELVVETERLRRKPRALGELTDAHHIHLVTSLA
jgi:hypothetical protein